MKRLLTLLCLQITVIVFTSMGCRTQTRKPVELHPVLGTELMIIPKGTKIDKYSVGHDGVYMSARVFFGMIDSLMEDSEEYHW